MIGHKKNIKYNFTMLIGIKCLTHTLYRLTTSNNYNREELDINKAQLCRKHADVLMAEASSSFHEECRRCPDHDGPNPEEQHTLIRPQPFTHQTL